MCGIYFYIHFNKTQGVIPSDIMTKLAKIKHRGPDETQIRHFDSTVNAVSITTAFHRLAVMDTSHAAMQPFEYKGMFCLINGEIWNSAKLLQELPEYKPHSHSDCEVILPMFEHYQKDIIKLCKSLDGEYAFVIYDSTTDMIYMSTDELSVRPLFYSFSEEGFGVASESKALSGEVSRLKPGSCCSWSIYEMLADKKCFNQQFIMYHALENYKLVFRSYQEVRDQLKRLFIASVQKKSHADRKIGCLLSGGLDSSLVCAVLASMHKEPIDTFTVGIVSAAHEELPADILAARKVAQHIGSNHHEILCTMQEALEAIPEVIKLIESWDQTTVRASTPMYLGLKYIAKNHSDIAVIYSGEVSDELLSGYLYNYQSPSAEACRTDAVRLLNEIHCFDGLRADRIVAGWGRELRLPFFDKDLLSWVLTSPPEYFAPAYQNMEKYILRDAFNEGNWLPHSVLWRIKEAFSDASSHKSSWKTYIQENLPEHIQTEDQWYLELFKQHGGAKHKDLIPHKWMPQWCPEVQNDSSATALNVHQAKLH